MNYDSFDHLEAALEAAFNNVILGVTLDNWDENHLSRLLVDAIRQNVAGTIHGPDPARLYLHAFKATGDLENRFGDLALLIDIHFADGTTYEGAAVLEAKKRELGSHKIPEIRLPQLRQIVKKAKHPLLLIFDREPVEGRLMSLDRAGRVLRPWGWEFVEGPKRFARAAVVPLMVALTTKRKDTWLYKFATPFSEQIALRYLQGLDLDSDEALLKLVKGRTRLVPRYLVTITLVHGGVDGPAADIPPPDVNGDVLQPFHERDDERA